MIGGWRPSVVVDPLTVNPFTVKYDETWAPLDMANAIGDFAPTPIISKVKGSELGGMPITWTSDFVAPPIPGVRRLSIKFIYEGNTPDDLRAIATRFVHAVNADAQEFMIDDCTDLPGADAGRVKCLVIQPTISVIGSHPDPVSTGPITHSQRTAIETKTNATNADCVVLVAPLESKFHIPKPVFFFPGDDVADRTPMNQISDFFKSKAV